MSPVAGIDHDGAGRTGQRTDDGGLAVRRDSDGGRKCRSTTKKGAAQDTSQGKTNAVHVYLQFFTTCCTVTLMEVPPRPTGSSGHHFPAFSRKMVEAAGVAPASSDREREPSTCVAPHRTSRRDPPVERARQRPATDFFSSRPSVAQGGTSLLTTPT